MPKFRLPHIFRALLHAVNLRHGTDGFTSPPKEGVLRIFCALKNPTASAGFEAANLGTKGQHDTNIFKKFRLNKNLITITDTLHKDIYIKNNFGFNSSEKKNCLRQKLKRKTKHFFGSINFFSENRAVFGDYVDKI